MNRAAWVLAVLAFAALLWANAAAALGAHPPNFFDGALFLLQSIFAAQGLAPYRDAGFVYPPGTAILFGQILGLATPAAIRLAAWSLSLALSLLNAALFWRLAPRPLPLAAFLLILATQALFWGDQGTEPITPTLVIAILLLALHTQRHGPTPARLAALAAAATLCTLFRWDRALAIALMLAGTAAILALAPRLIPSMRPAQPTLRHDARRLLAAATALAAGTALAGAIILAHAALHDAIGETLTWILVLPLAILPYRQLPLPWPASPFDLQAQWLAALLALALLALGAATPRPWRQPGTARLAEAAILLAVPLSVFPYAFGRADPAHFLPLSLLAATAALLAAGLWPTPARRLPTAALVALALPLAAPTALILAAIGPIPRPGLADWATGGWTAGCTPLFPPGARSLFVGQVRYDRFIVNIPLFHVARPDLRPATAFIAEEPGLQNTCRWGATIAAQLAAAPRPMLALLDTEPQPPEPNATRTMQSCGRIEAALSAMPHHTLGRCPFAGRTLELRLYE